MSLAEKILRALEQFFMKNRIALREGFPFQCSNQGQSVGHRRTAKRKRGVGFGRQYTKCYMKRHGNLESGVGRDIWHEGKAEWRPTRVAVSNQRNHAGFGSRSYDEAVAEASEFCSSLEDLATMSAKTGKGVKLQV